MTALLLLAALACETAATYYTVQAIRHRQKAIRLARLLGEARLVRQLQWQQARGAALNLICWIALALCVALAWVQQR